MKKYHSEACEAIYEEIMAEFEAGLISEAKVREYDEMCLVQEDEKTYEAETTKIEHVTA